MIVRFAQQDGMGWNSSSTPEGVCEDAAEAEAKAIAYFEDGGNGPIYGLTKSETWDGTWDNFPTDGDYGVTVTDDWAEGRPDA